MVAVRKHLGVLGVLAVKWGADADRTSTASHSFLPFFLFREYVDNANQALCNFALKF
jgi:hypothetical protein